MNSHHISSTCQSDSRLHPYDVTSKTQKPQAICNTKRQKKNLHQDIRGVISTPDCKEQKKECGIRSQKNFHYTPLSLQRKNDKIVALFYRHLKQFDRSCPESPGRFR